MAESVLDKLTVLLMDQILMDEPVFYRASGGLSALMIRLTQAPVVYRTIFVWQTAPGEEKAIDEIKTGMVLPIKITARTGLDFVQKNWDHRKMSSLWETWID